MSQQGKILRNFCVSIFIGIIYTIQFLKILMNSMNLTARADLQACGLLFDFHLGNCFNDLIRSFKLDLHLTMM